jgi:hypothetical protein
MIFFDILFYYYYLFNSKILSDDEPHATTNFTLSASESFLSYFIINWLSSFFLCKMILTKFSMACIFLFILLINYLVYIRSGRSRVLAEKKPKFFKSELFSILITLIFFIATCSTLFWSIDYFQYIIDNCK